MELAQLREVGVAMGQERSVEMVSEALWKGERERVHPSNSNHTHLVLLLIERHSNGQL